jgi:hypothetical protein
MAASGGQLVPLVPTSLAVTRLVYVPRRIFQIEPHQFMEFARSAFARGSMSGNFDALNNARRAVTSRMDALLYTSGLARMAKDKQWTFSQRLDALGEIGYSTPNGLDRVVNRPRNSLEHDYRFDPSALQLKNLIDLAGLYIGNTDRYLQDGVLRAAEFSDYRPRAWRGSFRRPRLAATTLVFDYDLDLIDSYSGRGFHATFVLKDLGRTVLVALFRNLLHASLTAPTARLRLRSEDEFLKLML